MSARLDEIASFRVSDGVNLHVEIGGSTTAQPVLLLHGFPDSTALWRHIAPQLADQYRVIAYDQRGFGLSDKPVDLSAYSVPRLMEDVSEVLEELGVERVHLVGHDWGANVAWAFAAENPHRVHTLTALSSGHPVFKRDIRSLEKAWYVFVFQFAVAERLFAADDWALFRAWAQNHPETDSWIERLARPGALTAGMNWYRANYPAERGFALPHTVGEVTVPTLGIFGSEDPYLAQERMEQSAAKVRAPWHCEIVTAGHWLPLDAPEFVTAKILELIETNGAMR